MRNRARKGGGCAIFVHDSLDVLEINDKFLREKIEAEQIVEQVWCQLGRGSEAIRMGCIYRPPLKSNDASHVKSHFTMANAINSTIAEAKQAVDCKK